MIVVQLLRHVQSLRTLPCSPLASPFSFCLQSFPASGSFPMSGLFASVAKVLDTRLLSSSLSPTARSNSHPSSWWCHPTISSSVVPFSSHLQSFPASGSFPVSQFFTAGGHSIGASASPSALPINIQDWFPVGLTGLIPYCLKDSQESSPTAQFDNSYHPKHPHPCNHLCIIFSNFLTGCLLTMIMSASVIHANYTYFSIVFLLIDLFYIHLLQLDLCSVESIQHTVILPGNDSPSGAFP